MEDQAAGEELQTEKFCPKHPQKGDDHTLDFPAWMPLSFFFLHKYPQKMATHFL